MIQSSHPHPSGQDLQRFLEAKLSAAETQQIRDHLAQCPECAHKVVAPAAGPSPTISFALGADKGEGLFPAESVIPLAQEELPADLVNHARYRILGLLGEGGMGTVYLAEHLLMDRKVALKTIKADRLEREQLVQRFRLEVKAAARLSHPNIVQAFDADQSGSLHLLVMEYVEGLPISVYLQRHGRLPVHQACDFIRQVALGLQHAHARGMVHRDVKPQNLMLTAAGQIKILDFGLARVFAAQGQEREAQLTGAGVVMGTADYLAPEQALDSHEVDHRADIYSLGCTLYHLLTGEVPFPGGGWAKKVLRHSRELPPDPCLSRPDLPVELGDLVQKMMAKTSSQRLQTAGEVARALEPFAVAPNEIEERHSTSSIAITKLPLRDNRLTQEAPGRKRRVLALRSIAVLCLASILALLFWFSKNPYPENSGKKPEPDAPETNLARAQRLLQEERDLPTVIALASDAIRTEPGNDIGYYVRGSAHLAKEELDLALPDLEMAARLNPKNADAVRQIGRVYAKKNDFDRAIAQADQALDIDRLCKHAYLDRAEYYSKLNEWDRAIEDASAFLELNPRDGEALAVRAGYYFGRRLYDRAIADATEALNLKARNRADALFVRARAYLFQKDYDEARQDMDAALKIDPKNAKFYYVRSLVCSLQGNQLHAQSDRNYALKMDPNLAQNPPLEREKLFWPREPDRKGWKALLGDDFRDPMRSVFKSTFGTFRLKGQKLATEPLSRTWIARDPNPLKGPLRKVAVEIIARIRKVSSQDLAGTVGLELRGRLKTEKEGFLYVRVSSEGTLELGKAPWNTENSLPDHLVQPVTHSAIAKAGSFNRLLVVFDNNVVSVYLNGVRIVEGLRVDGFSPVMTGALSTQIHSGSGSAEFTHYTVWELPPDKTVTDPEAEKRIKIAQHIAEAREAARKGLHELAIAHCTEALRVDPKQFDALYLRALQHYKLGQWHDMATDAEKAVKIRPDHLDVMGVLTHAYLETERPEQCIDLATAMLEKDPNYLGAFNNRACAYRDVGQFEDALVDVNKLLELSPGSAQYWSWRARYHKRLGNEDQAQKDRAEAIARDSKYAKMNFEPWPLPAMQRFPSRKPGYAWKVAFSPKGDRLYACGGEDHLVRSWELPSGKQATRFQGHTAELRALAVSPDGRWLASGAQDGTARLWDRTSGKQILEFAGIRRACFGLAFAPDSRRVVGDGGDDKGELGPARVWDVHDGRILATAQYHANAVAFHPDGRHFLGGTTRELRYFAVETGKSVQDLPGHRFWIRAVAASRNGEFGASGSGSTSEYDPPNKNDDFSVRIWQLPAGKQLHLLTAHSHTVWGVAFSPDSSKLASCGFDRTIRFWDVKTGKELWKIDVPVGVLDVAYSPSGREIAAACMDGMVRLWRLPKSVLDHAGKE